MSLAALVLAAGESSRLGRPKQLLDWGATTLLGQVIERTLAWPIAAVTVVLGARADEITARVDLTAVDSLINDEWPTGMASSLRSGLARLALNREIEAVFVVMGDQPAIDPEVPRVLAEVRSRTASRAVVPSYRGVRSNPVLVDRTLWPALMALDGDVGARGLLAAHPEWVAEVEFDLDPPRSVNTEQDVAELGPE